jgi:hypothetical protein
MGDQMHQVTVTEPAVLIRIQRSYDPKMSHKALYEVTRGVWKVGERREQVEIALAVFDGIVREIFVIDQWRPAGSTTYETRPREDVEIEGRWEFTGSVAPENIRSKYLGSSVAHYFSRGNSNPILYVNA